MNLYEFQAKEVFRDAGLPVPRYDLSRSAEEDAAVLDRVGPPWVLKAQVLRGGRGKAGLVSLPDSRDEALAELQRIRDAAPDAHSVLVQQRVEIERELYLAATVDPAEARVLLLASAAGGVDVERSASRSGAVNRVSVDTGRGVMPFQIRNLTAGLDLDKPRRKALGRIAADLYALLRSKDATLAEINPLAITPDGTLVAADAKLVIDDNAAFRQPFEPNRESYAGETEYEAAQKGIPYVQFDGNIGLMCAGAGLTNTVNDLIHDFGGSPANFLEFGGPNYRRAREAMELTLKSDPKVILVVTFGTIARADVMAEGIAEAIEALQPDIPIVTAIRGTNEEKAAEILRGIGLEPIRDTEEAVRKAVALAEGTSS